jgi:hypothetical protein
LQLSAKDCITASAFLHDYLDHENTDGNPTYEPTKLRPRFMPNSVSGILGRVKFPFKSCLTMCSGWPSVSSTASRTDLSVKVEVKVHTRLWAVKEIISLSSLKYGDAEVELGGKILLTCISLSLPCSLHGKKGLRVKLLTNVVVYQLHVAR